MKSAKSETSRIARTKLAIKAKRPVWRTARAGAIAGQRNTAVMEKSTTANNAMTATARTAWLARQFTAVPVYTANIIARP